MRVGVAAAPRWWGVEPAGLDPYLDHLAASGATAVELIVHDGPASRDPSTVHLPRSLWSTTVARATSRGLHVDVHNSLDPRLSLERFAVDASGFAADIASTLDLLADIEQHQGTPPSLVVHADTSSPDPEAATASAMTWIANELVTRGSAGPTCLELRSAASAEDRRFDRRREALVDFVDRLADDRLAVCWDVANDWLTARRSSLPYALPEAVPARLGHVHLHDALPDGLLHAPLADGGVPWGPALELLRDARWGGSATLEIRYRLASDVGEPWAVLAESIRRALSVER